MKTVDRLFTFIEYCNLSARQFDLSIGASNGYSLRMRKNKASIGSDVIENIVKVYPQLNLVWLITGEGTMLNPDKELLRSKELPKDEQERIEALVEKTIRDRQEKELKQLLQEVTQEIEKRKGGDS